MSGLWILIIGGFLQVFVGGELTQTGMAIGGAILFSGTVRFINFIFVKSNSSVLNFKFLKIFLQIFNHIKISSHLQNSQYILSEKFYTEISKFF